MTDRQAPEPAPSGEPVANPGPEIPEPLAPELDFAASVASPAPETPEPFAPEPGLAAPAVNLAAQAVSPEPRAPEPEVVPEPEAAQAAPVPEAPAQVAPEPIAEPSPHETVEAEPRTDVEAVAEPVAPAQVAPEPLAPVAPEPLAPVATDAAADHAPASDFGAATTAGPESGEPVPSPEPSPEPAPALVALEPGTEETLALPPTTKEVEPPPPEPSAPPPPTGVPVPFSAPPTERNGGRFALKLVLGIGGGSLLAVGVIVAIIAAFVVFANSVTDKVEATAEDFVGEIADEDWDAAYAMLCDDLRDRPVEDYVRDWETWAVDGAEVGPVNADATEVEVRLGDGTSIDLYIAVDQSAETLDTSVCGWRDNG
ncbi:hypothetical protein [Glycomyces paridis]|uniref:DUF4878 domain-containing protein n=1 Tax=Glycomyces paridis TaxID=2126555 RepID=A0A4V4HPW2_9ACTN|nr:hypothetical protein [Glycomyces paridis]THV31436.1 hypothetical protein E9998_03475 [Glycomyces paridis]